MQIRDARPEEFETLGAITLEAYVTLDGHIADAEYEAELADVRTRAAAPGAAVLVAVSDDDRTLLGGVTYVDDHGSPMAEHVPPDAASIRMLAVHVAGQGKGVGRALTEECIARARASGKAQLVLHSTPWMTVAHRLYEDLGFVRDPSQDWVFDADLTLWYFRLQL